jgi:hypothetical protein
MHQAGMHPIASRERCADSGVVSRLVVSIVDSPDLR